LAEILKHFYLQQISARHEHWHSRFLRLNKKYVFT